MTPLPMSVQTFLSSSVAPALALLPKALDTPTARVLIATIAQQESGLMYRQQLGGGPAHGLCQFELGTQASRGGVWGVYLHPASNDLLRQMCRARDCTFDPVSIWGSLLHDDVLAAGVARLMLLTNASRLPAADDAEGGWAYYVLTWRPGKPRRETWDEYHAKAFDQVVGSIA